MGTNKTIILKTKSLRKIRKDAKSLAIKIRQLYDKIDNLMDDSETSAEYFENTDVNKSMEFNKYASILQDSKNGLFEAAEVLDEILSQ